MAQRNHRQQRAGQGRLRRRRRELGHRMAAGRRTPCSKRSAPDRGRPGGGSMLIQRLTTAVAPAEGAPTASQPLMPRLPAKLSFASRIVAVAPSSATRPHEHHESEIWLVLAGRGEMIEDQDRQLVEAGDAIYLP